MYYKINQKKVMDKDTFYMNQALKLARQAYDDGEVPIGAVIVCNDKIISKAYNQTERLNDVTAHAEMIALTSAMNNIGAKYLKNCTLYVTLEPCNMCAGATYWAQIKQIAFAAYDKKRGFLQNKNITHPKTKIKGGVLETESLELLQKFFKEKR